MDIFGGFSLREFCRLFAHRADPERRADWLRASHRLLSRIAMGGLVFAMAVGAAWTSQVGAVEATEFVDRVAARMEHSPVLLAELNERLTPEEEREILQSPHYEGLRDERRSEIRKEREKPQ
ncbi:MAG: hypothetical protein HYY93_10860 [Planctomycetes bacterium]|nr:hypothetical protein [Planctomycetota bacterium]